MILCLIDGVELVVAHVADPLSCELVLVGASLPSEATELESALDALGHFNSFRRGSHYRVRFSCDRKSCTGGGSRTRKSFKTLAFKARAFTVSPRPRKNENNKGLLYLEQFDYDNIDDMVFQILHHKLDK